MLASHILSLVLLAQSTAEKDPSKVGQKHGCTQDGRYWVHQDKGKKVYCWEGAGYNEDGAPPFVKTYFASPSDKKEPPASPDVPFVPVGSTAPAKSSPGGGGGGGASGGGGGGGGGGTPKTQTFGAGGGQGSSADYRGSGSGGGKIKDALRDIAREPGSNAASGGGRREPDPVSAQVLDSIEMGMTRATVVERLGEPHGKILNTGDEGTLEIWTYVVRGGGFGSVRLDQGRVVKVVRPR